MPRLRRISDVIKVMTSFSAVLANSTQNGNTVDTRGYRHMTAILTCWTGSATTCRAYLSESVDGSTWTDVRDASNNIIYFPGTAVPAATAADGGNDGVGNANTINGITYMMNVDLAGFDAYTQAKRKRYWRINVVGTGTAGSADAYFLLYDAAGLPTTQVQTVVSNS